MKQINDGSISYKDELIRKVIHLSSLSIPSIYYYISRELALTILGILSLLALIIDLGRYHFSKFGELFYNIFGFLLRKHEKDKIKKNLNGATYVLISAFLGVLILPKLIFINAFAILIISDSSAALIGRRFGKTPFLKKSLQGTIAFFISAIIVIVFAPKYDNLFGEYLIGILAAVVGSIVENISNDLVDDNLSIPLIIGFFMWGLYLIFFPELIIKNNFKI